jgi:hypothetical protein
VVYNSPNGIYKYSRTLTEEDPGNLHNLSIDPNEIDDLLDHSDPKLLERMREQAHLHFTSY